jgi:hypothetical protein
MVEEETKELKVYTLNPIEVEKVDIPSNIIRILFKSGQDVIQTIHNLDMTEDYDIYSYEDGEIGYVPVAADCVYMYKVDER